MERREKSVGVAAGLKPGGTREGPFDILALGDRPHLAINTTIRCQHRCEYCFEGDRKGHGEVSLEQVRELLQPAVGRYAGVVFMGAEPTLNSKIVEMTRLACSLGLSVSYSTNGIRFSDIGFLRACLQAGLSGLEMSFPYPDETAYSGVTRRPPAGFRRLLSACDNIERVNRESERTCGTPVGVNVNCVVSAVNVNRLEEVISLLRERFVATPWVLTFKCLSVPHMPPDQARRYWVPLARLRDAFEALPADMETAFGAAAVMFRGFPLCAIPGREERAVDITAVFRGVQIAHNFHEQSNIEEMFPAEILRVAHPYSWWCSLCTLDPICLFRSLFQAGDHVPEACPVPWRGPVPERLLGHLEAATAGAGVAEATTAAAEGSASPTRTLADAVLQALVKAPDGTGGEPRERFHWIPLPETGVVELGQDGVRFRVRVGPETEGLDRWWAVRDDGLVGVREAESAAPVDPGELDAFLRWVLALDGRRGPVPEPWLRVGRFLTIALFSADPGLRENPASVWFRTTPLQSTHPAMEVHVDDSDSPHTRPFVLAPLNEDVGSGFLCGRVRIVAPLDALSTGKGRRRFAQVFQGVLDMQKAMPLPPGWPAPNDLHREAWRRFGRRLVPLGDSNAHLTGGEVHPDRIVLIFQGSDGTDVRACLKKGLSGDLSWSRDPGQTGPRST